MSKDATTMMRDTIVAKPEEFSAITEAPSFKDHSIIIKTKLERTPKRYDPNHSMASYLRHKSWCLEYSLMDNEAEDREKFLTLACTLFHAIKPFHDFMSTALQDFQSPQRQRYVWISERNMLIDGYGEMLLSRCCIYDIAFIHFSQHTYLCKTKS